LIAVAHARRGEGHDASEDGTGRGTPIVAVAGALCRDSFSGGAGGRPEGAAAGHFVPVAFRTAGDGAVYEEGEITAPLTTATDPNAQVVAFDMRGREGGAMPEGPHDNANIRAGDGGSSRSYVAQPWAVRRLTPRECERLMDFPDGFTAIPWRKKPASVCPDGPRYKALGNSWAVNVAEWVGERIAIVDAWPENETRAARPTNGDPHGESQ